MMAKASEKTHCVGFDLGGTKIMSMVYDRAYNPVGKSRRKTKGHLGAETGVQRIVRTIRESLEAAEVAPQQLSCIGVGSPGPLDLEKGIILDTPNLGWKNVKLRKILQAEFGCSATIANDVDMGLYGEYCFGCAQNVRCAVGIFPGTGIGGACVYAGKIFQGRRHSCMEVGHMLLMPEGPQCACGQKGCLEALASRLAISAEASQAVYRGAAPHLAGQTGGVLSEIRSGALAESVRNGDAAVEDIIRRAAQWIGVGAANLVNLLAPQIIVLGGGLVEAMPEIFLAEVSASAAAHALPGLRDSFVVKAAELGDDATTLGAAAWARRALESNAK